jgi:hypothetical protein
MKTGTSEIPKAQLTAWRGRSGVLEVHILGLHIRNLVLSISAFGHPLPAE